MDTVGIRYLALGLMATALFALVYRLVVAPSPPVPRFGYRGEKRRRALQRNGSFRLIEPLVRRVAGGVSVLDLGERRAAIERSISRSGEALGITADELVALSALSAVLFGIVGAWFSWKLDAGSRFSLLGLALGATLPWTQLYGATRRRFKQIEQWRDELVAGAAERLEWILAHFPAADRGHLSKLMARAGEPTGEKERRQAGRELFRYLKKISE